VVDQVVLVQVQHHLVEVELVVIKLLAMAQVHYKEQRKN
jgi:hypothetical protein